MVRLLLLLFAGASGSQEIFADGDSLSLLQLKVVSQPKAALHVATNSSRVRNRNPGERERQQCPHEIETVIQPGNKPFGCRGRLQAPSTKECSFWGEPHVSRSWPSQLPRGEFDVLYKPGLFRMAAAADGSWE